MPGNAKQKCPKAGNLYIEVKRQNREAHDQFDILKEDCTLTLNGGDVDEPVAQTTGVTTYSNLCAGGYTLDVTPQGEEAGFEITEEVEQQGEELQPETSVGNGAAAGRGVTIEDTKTRMHYYKLYPCELLVKVKAKDQDTVKGDVLEGVKVAVTSEGPLKDKSVDTDNKGVADHGIVPSGSKFTLKLTLTPDQAKTYEVEESYGEAPAQRLGKDPYLIELKTKPIYLQLFYKDLDEKTHPIPKDFPVTVVFSDPDTASQKETVSDDKGNLSFMLAPGKKKFTLKPGDDKVRCFVQKKEEDAWVPDDTPVIEDPDDGALRALTLDGKRFFCLPKNWSLAKCDWEEEGLSVPKDGLCAIPPAGKCTKEAPGKLTLLPKLQYVRFEFHDRRYGRSDHNKKRVSIPAIVLKGARVGDASGAAVDPCGGTHDAVSNWMYQDTDITKASQCLPWIITKDDNGDPLPDLDNTMFFEFGWPDGFVCSEDAADVTKRKIEELAANDDKRKPSIDRPKYYDLPAVWKSINYYARFTDDSKIKFFDELSTADIKIADSNSTPLIFSLDDIVLTDNGDNQIIEDEDNTGTAKALAEESRVAQLWLDPDDGTHPFGVKVWKPRTDGGYFSELGFTEDAAGDWRNVITEYCDMVRAITFCGGFHDIYDKRTTLPTGKDFSDGCVVGARAAKLNDSDVSFTESIQQTASFEKYTAKDCGNFDLVFLQYAAVDTANSRMLFALVTYWSCRLTPTAPATAADVTKYREEGMTNTMARWNAKGYEIEVDGLDEVRGKTFSLFEARSDDWGGQDHKCLADIHGGNDYDNWMALDTGHFAKVHFEENPGAYRAETADHDGTTYPCMTTGHELGHASGLDDEYTYALDGFPGVIRYEQYYDGMPYEIDLMSLMFHCEALRLRHYWGKVSWINENAASVPGLCSNGADEIKDKVKDKLAVVYESANLEYTRPAGETLKDVYTPLHKETGAALSAAGTTTDFYLYRLGEDEFAHNLKDGPYKGILVVSPKISARFEAGAISAWATGTAYTTDDLVEEGGKTYQCVSGHTGSAAFATDSAHWWEITDKGAWVTGTAYNVDEVVECSGAYYVCATGHTAAADFKDDSANWVLVHPDASWTDVQKAQWLSQLDADTKTMIRDKFRLVCAGNDLSKTYVSVFPQFEIVKVGAGAGAGSNYELKLKRDGSATFTADPGNVKLEVGESCDKKKIIRHIFGKTGGGTTDLSVADLADLKTWIGGKAGGTWTLENIP